jgi:hypothetical protein
VGNETGYTFRKETRRFLLEKRLTAKHDTWAPTHSLHLYITFHVSDSPKPWAGASIYLDPV